uniref:Ribosomal protein L35 n=1 Tax=Tsukubamonas globosa TaxID=875863 RepID=W8VKJ6_9EUKA|nr:ribosomal protein L35 [Tsukubamonas globosa]BAO51986.1 ribosomal protein L35 [Tsukubamonas globosa]
MKQKTNSGFAKRFFLVSNKKLKYFPAGKRHNLSNKSGLYNQKRSRCCYLFN